MLDPTWPWTPLLLWIALAGLLALLIVRTALKDRREYQRFKRYRATLKRQAMFRKWLIDSLWSIGGVSLVLIALSWQFIGPLLAELQAILPIPASLAWAVVIGMIAGLGILTVVGIRSARRHPEDIPTVGDIGSMLPRNKQELRYGWALSINAGISEELLFRLAMPAVIYGASGNALLALIVPLVLFGALHLYQGPAGIIGTAVIGSVMALAYIGTGTVIAPILMHALVDLRSLVVIPVTLYGAHEIDGRVQKYIPRPRPKPIAEPVVADAPAAETP
jgi:membrane protease YdiL (CAAX protease family)